MALGGEYSMCYRNKPGSERHHQALAHAFQLLVMSRSHESRCTDDNDLLCERKANGRCGITGVVYKLTIKCCEDYM